MAPIVLPTRNRPNSLEWVLRYYAKYYPGTRLIIADGSTERFKPLNRAVTDSVGTALEIEYLPYPDALPLFDRLIDVIRNCRDEFIIMGSDDDFPVMETLKKGENFLRKSPEFSTALGSLVHMRMFSPEVMNVRLDVVRQIGAKTPQSRVRQFSQWSFSTTYAVTRREHLLERYELAQRFFLAGFYDFIVGCHDAIRGKIRAMPEVGFFCTRNYNHSYLRATAPLVYLRKAEQVLEFNDYLIDELKQAGNISDEEAQEAARLAINRRVAALAGTPITRTAGFTEAPYFQHPTVQGQLKLFHEMFAEGTEARERYLERMQFILDAMKSNADSSDNEGEEEFYESLDEQLVGAGKE
jgi:glycosyltransferase domain-containing protein